MHPTAHPMTPSEHALVQSSRRLLAAELHYYLAIARAYPDMVRPETLARTALLEQQLSAPSPTKAGRAA